jgi:uncharacterized membrane protein YkoI
MRRVLRFAIPTLLLCALTSARGEDAARPAAASAETMHCLDQKERRAESETGHLVRLDAAMRVARGRMPGTVVQARLCRSGDDLVYVLTVLTHDGKVGRLTVDAVKGTLVGGL